MSHTSMPPGSLNSAPADFFEAMDTVTVANGFLAPEQIELVRTTWTYIAPIAEETATLFYNRLFELDPAIKPMFAASNLKVQKRKLMQTIGVAVKRLHRFEEIAPWCATSASATQATACRTGITTPWAKRSCGRLRRASAIGLPTRSETPGPPPTTSSPIP